MVEFKVEHVHYNKWVQQLQKKPPYSTPKEGCGPQFWHTLTLSPTWRKIIRHKG